MPYFTNRGITPLAGGSAYEGPGDVVSGALAWWGLRAYSAATIGQNAIRLRRVSDDAELNIATIAGGGLDISAITTFKGASTVEVRTLYDQTGNGFNLTTTDPAYDTPFTLSGFGSLPVLDFASNSFLIAGGSMTQAQPYTIISVAKNTNSGSLGGTIGIAATTYIGYNNSAVADTVRIGAGAPVNFAFTDGNWLALQAIFNGDSSVVSLNGTETASDTSWPGTGSISGVPTVGAISSSFAFPFEGFWGECGIWGSAFNGTQRDDMDDNIRTYWVIV